MTAPAVVETAATPARPSAGELARRYPAVLATLVVGVVGIVLALSGLPEVARWLVSAFALLVAAFQLWRMIREATQRGHWGLDILAITAIVATTLTGDYWAALVVCLMLTGGEALEDYASARARRQVRDLLRRAPQLAHRLDADGAAADVAVTELDPGDHVLVKPGEVVPVDGEITSGESEFDESTITGESLPVSRRPGDVVLSGTVNGSSPVVVVATTDARGSQYQQIIEMVQAAADTKGRFIRLADRFAVPFTIVAFAIAITAWVVSGDPVRFGEVLVVATPCPLLIAAPVAFVAGMGRSAREGVIIKGGESIEKLAGARTMAFDKTGTLTRGAPVVDRVEAFADLTSDELLGIAAAAERGSSHVLARSIVEAAERRGVPAARVVDVSEVTAHGMRARLDGRAVVVGKVGFVASETTGLQPRDLAPGEMAVYLGVGGTPAGRIVLRDEVRQTASPTLDRLRRLGVAHVVMLTGDAEPTARHVAAELGIDDVRAGLLPADKVSAVAGLPDRPVVMVGDGVNDAPVLAAADAGVAMGARGSTAASESADVVILVDEIAKVADAVEIARRTVRIALQSIWFGISISVVLMVIAAFGVIPAIVGALLQEAIDVVTILNGLRAAGSRRR